MVFAAVACVAAPAIASGSPAGSAPRAAITSRATLKPPNVWLTGVSCSTAASCFAVGYTFSDSSARSRTLTERWNGKSWAIVASPNPAVISQLTGVSCTSAINCVAVGFTQPNSRAFGNGLVLRWNGKTWSTTTLSNHQLFGVSCTSPTFCIAVGDAIQRWNGKTWSMVKSPAKSGGIGVSCISAASCFAVGGVNPERWNGKAWSIVPDASLGRSDAFLAGVSCTSAASCQGVGTEGGCLDCFDNWAEGWDGKTWDRVTAPEPPGTQGAELNGVSCPTATSCVAVGVFDRSEFPFTEAKTFAEQWNGRTWSAVETPYPTLSRALLNAVSCPSPTSCFAVGESSLVPHPENNPFPPKSLVEHWNGTKWSIIASPNPPASPAMRPAST